MEPALLHGSYVIFAECGPDGAVPRDGDIVQAYVETRKTPPPRRWWQVWRKPEAKPWTEGDDVLKIEGFSECLVIRRFGHDAAGKATLTADAEGFPSWAEGEGEDGQDVAFCIAGVATIHKVLFHCSHEVFCVPPGRKGAGTYE